MRSLTALPVEDAARRTTAHALIPGRSARHNAASIQKRGPVSQHRKCFHDDNRLRRRQRVCAGSGAGTGAGRVEVTYTPGGAAYVAAKDDAPSFGNYGFGTSVTFNLNRFLGIEGEIGTMIATTSEVQFGDLDSNTKAPNFLNYTANLVVSPWIGHSVVPYGTGGIGGLTMFERPEVGVHSDETFLATNVGGGVKWYSSNNRWGLRGDYRFGITRSKDDAPEFFGRDTRYFHRVYGGVIINMGR